jgi:hypothetical protein
VDTRSAIRLTTSKSCIRLFISAHKLSTPTVFDDNSEELELRSDFMLLPRFKPAARRRLNVGEALVSCTCRNTVRKYDRLLLWRLQTVLSAFWDTMLCKFDDEAHVPLKRQLTFNRLQRLTCYPQ